MDGKIYISESSWIDKLDLEDPHEQAIEVDPLLVNLEPLWGALELHCVAECCGFDAFDFCPDAITSTVAKMNPQELHAALTKAIHDVESIESATIVSTRLNNYAHKKTFWALLSHIQACVHSQI
ncbi:DUF6331 family protein [Halodesulfovibrio spirochaetisodalis]|uniref:Uncharacterized protein n=1 Tax=Halodesulfovibrio spirochaetisodalis TaxID=1560234 RepID=A0A1B7X9M1_9BACT|nr:DUF6331 family protein [Halodesulfovibrio spirochaetisodalis]OBQ46061.1 hypothetical protein SP90_14270 [Halodesulfovibrio spirochaetisodalis]